MSYQECTHCDGSGVRHIERNHHALTIIGCPRCKQSGQTDLTAQVAAIQAMMVTPIVLLILGFAIFW